MADAEALLLVDDDQTKIAELTSFWRRRWVPITMSTVPG